MKFVVFPSPTFTMTARWLVYLCWLVVSVNGLLPASAQQKPMATPQAVRKAIVEPSKAARHAAMDLAKLKKEELQDRLLRTKEAFDERDREFQESVELRKGRALPKEESDVRRGGVWDTLGEYRQAKDSAVKEELDQLGEDRLKARKARYAFMKEDGAKRRERWENQFKCSKCGERVYPGEEHECSSQ